jgi:hypothetical protein|tara:strand:- start:550 stop:1155 length:606 start_codon:yes stop_codon:yes gene_type:complete
MTSVVDIANYALNSLGASNITSLGENSKPARIVNQRYEAVRDSVFRSHPWNCLIRRAELAQETDAPVYGYAYNYALPSDPYCLRVLQFSNGSMTYPYDNMRSNSDTPAFIIEGRKLLTDEGTVKIKYVARITDPQQYDAGLVEVLASRLAYELSYAITGSTTVRQIAAADFDRKLKDARFEDATEGAPERIEASDFIEARF